MSNSRVGRLSSKFSDQTQAPAYSAWAKMHDNEMKERQGDGYSAWEYMSDSVTGIPAMVSKGLRVGYDGGDTASKGLDSVLERMRNVSDKKGQGLSGQDQRTVQQWEQLKRYGQVP